MEALDLQNIQQQIDELKKELDPLRQRLEQVKNQNSAEAVGVLLCQAETIFFESQTFKDIIEQIKEHASTGHRAIKLRGEWASKAETYNIGKYSLSFVGKCFARLGFRWSVDSYCSKLYIEWNKPKPHQPPKKKKRFLLF